MKDPFCGITFELLRDLMAKQGFGDDIALKTVTNFYRRRIYDFSGMNNITKKVREFLEMRFEPGLFSPVRSERSSDLSAKFLSYQPRRNHLKQSLFLTGKGELYVFRPNRAAEWGARSVLQACTGSEEVSPPGRLLTR